jgi:CheY-like chemotaxis protein/HPt (histidine-containing phosphotransfer) domain-containing protein
MSGRLWVESEEGKGSTFHFVVRFELADADALPARSEPGTIDIRGTHTLVVDDNATNRRVLCAMIRNWGLDPVEAENGPVALDLAKQAIQRGRPFKLILLDAMMPAMDGFELAEHLTAIPHSSAVLMMLSSADHAGDASRCRELGIAGYLTKPIKQSELLNMTVTSLHARPVTPQARTPLSAGSASGATPLHILLAEDNLVNQKLAMSLLKKEGHEVKLAENGREALDWLEKERFDLVFMDVQMPVMGGFEATAEIRRREEGTGRHLPIIAMTANAMKGDRERCLEAGMDEYVSKPIDPDRLRRMLNEWRSRCQQTSPNQPGRDPDGEAFGPDADGGVSFERPLDTADVLRRAADDHELVREMVDSFVRDVPRLMHELHSAASAGDAPAVAASAHSLKGAAAAVSAEPARRLAEQVETIGRSGELDSLESHLDALQRQVDVLVEFIDSMDR